MVSTGSRRLRTAALALVDAVGYATLVTVVALVTALVVGIATGGGFVRAKALLFVGGILLMGYATLLLWPSSPEDLASGSGPRGGETIPAPADRTRLESLTRTLPPWRWLPSPPPGDGMSVGGKLFLGSLLVLLASYLMETVFGVV